MTASAALVTAVLALGLAATPRTRRRLRAALKMAASTGFVVTALSAGAVDTAYGRWVLVALSLGWIGDAALLSGRSRWFLTGLAVFGGSHLAYVGAMATQPMSIPGGVVAAAVMAVTAAAILRWLMPHVGGAMRTPVLAYVAVISAMVVACGAAAAGGGPHEVLPAGAAFAASDVFVARDRFVAPGPENGRLGLPLYYAAQIVFALSVGAG